MEKKNMEKIDKLYDLVVSKEDALRKRLRSILESLYTDEMKKIMEVLVDHYKRKINFDEDGAELSFASKSKYETYTIWEIKLNRLSNDGQIAPGSLLEKTYEDNMISHLEYHVRRIKKIDENLTFIEDHMEEFITKIGEYYREFAEKESDQLDALLAEMDYGTTPTKHLKVTVEWV